FADAIILRKVEGGSCAGNVVEVLANQRGIYIYGTPAPTNIVVADNLLVPLSATGTYGVKVLSGDRLAVSGNRVQGTAAFGVSLDNATTNCLVYGNHLADCTTPLTLGTGAGHESFGNLVSANLQVAAKRITSV